MEKPKKPITCNQDDDKKDDRVAADILPTFFEFGNQVKLFRELIRLYDLVRGTDEKQPHDDEKEADPIGKKRPSLRRGSGSGPAPLL